MFSKRLAQIRKARGLSQYELANRLGYSRGQISNYEQGTRQPDLETLNKIADFFEVTSDYLLGRSNDPRLNADQQIEVNKEFKKLKEMISELPDGPEKSKVIQRILDYTAGLVDGSKDHKLHE